MQIDVFSDTICPWCWIGKRRLERALASRPDLDARVVGNCFQLNPDMPGDGMDRRDYLESKFGGTRRASAIYARISEEGAKESLPFAFDRIPRTPNTLDSHRLVLWAATQPPGQEPMVEALFRAYFTDGEDVSDAATLARIAGKAGYDAAGAAALLAGRDAREAVRAQDQQARDAGITGVPCFIIDARVAVPGAVEPGTMLEIFERYSIGETGGSSG